MDFTLSDEQRLLKDSVDRLMADRYAFDQRKSHFKEPAGWSTALWSQYAELGLLGLPFAEEYGGFGGGAVEIMLVMEAFGRALILEPYLATVVLGGTAVRLGASEALKSRVLPAIADGSMKLAFAHGERQARYDVTDVMTTAKESRGGWVLDGAKSVVTHGDCADTLVVSARTSGERDDADGITLFLVDAQGERRGTPRLHDARRAARGGSVAVGRAGRRRCRAWRGRQGAVADRTGDRGRHRRDRRGKRRRDGSAAQHDAGSTAGRASSSASRSALIRSCSIGWPRC